MKATDLIKQLINIGFNKDTKLIFTYNANQIETNYVTIEYLTESNKINIKLD